MIQKSVLVGCRESSWISCADVRHAHLHGLNFGSVYHLEFRHDPSSNVLFKGLTEVSIPDEADFIRIRIEEGPHENALVYLKGESARAFQTA